MNALVRLHRASMRFDPQIEHWGGAILSLLIRCYVGWQFFKSGMVKLADWNSTLALFHDEYSVPLLPPDVAAYMGAGGELFFPSLLFVGLFSRPAAIGLFFVNLVAVISYPQLREFECPAAINDHFYWGVMILVVAVFGPGRISLDALLGRRTAA